MQVSQTAHEQTCEFRHTVMRACAPAHGVCVHAQDRCKGVTPHTALPALMPSGPFAAYKKYLTENMHASPASGSTQRTNLLPTCPPRHGSMFFSQRIQQCGLGSFQGTLRGVWLGSKVTEVKKKKATSEGKKNLLQKTTLGSESKLGCNWKTSPERTTYDSLGQGKEY